MIDIDENELSKNIINIDLKIQMSIDYFLDNVILHHIIVCSIIMCSIR